MIQRGDLWKSAFTCIHLSLFQNSVSSANTLYSDFVLDIFGKTSVLHRLYEIVVLRVGHFCGWSVSSYLLRASSCKEEEEED